MVLHADTNPESVSDADFEPDSEPDSDAGAGADPYALFSASATMAFASSWILVRCAASRKLSA